MKTKIVYVVTSSLEDLYWEQAWVSAWSLRQHNSKVHVAVVCDEDTFEVAKGSFRSKSLELFDEIVPVPFDLSVSKKARSRWLKTNLRNLIKGDFLFVDTDTIITGDLCEIDDFDFDMGMVYDMHKHPCPVPQFFNWVEFTYGLVLPSDARYYNSGVIFAKDNDVVKRFFDSWHKNWELAGDKVGFTDQTPLAKTVLEKGNPICELSGIYNCQVCNGIKYLYKAKILHIFNNPWFFPTVIHPFMLKETYQIIQQHEDLPEEIKQLAINCKSEFSEISAPLSINEANFIRFPVIHNFLYPLYVKKRHLFIMVDNFTFYLLRLYSKFCSIKKWLK